MYYFIINPASQSGRGYKIWKKIEQRLVRDGVEYQAYLTEYAGQATEYARKLTSHCKEARVIVAHSCTPASNHHFICLPNSTLFSHRFT